MRGTLVVSLIIAVFAVIFALSNPQMMEVNLLVGDIQGSTALVLIITFAIGVLVGILAAIPSRLKRRRQKKEGAPAASTAPSGAPPSSERSAASPGRREHPDDVGRSAS